MTRDEMKQILARVDVLFPNWHPADLSLTIDVWMEELGNLRYDEVLIAVKTYTRTDTTGFAPTISKLLEIINDIKADIYGGDLSEMQAWALVSKALRDSTYHAKERFNELPVTVQKAVGSSEVLSAWGTAENYNENVAQSNFIKAYRNVLEREKKISVYPAEIQNRINAAQTKLIGGNNG
ncbi:MAG: replicative helicase loader/inhibitor [Clostridia bacterium]|nr:replicative helicase loader/inhibitor [Clostridia bacterium]